MELLAPAGSLEKLYYAYGYGADSAYIGIGQFSLRTRADNFNDKQWQDIAAFKGRRKLFAALNIYFHDTDLHRLEKDLDYIARYPIDAFIISDIGILPVIKKHFPDIELHLSTQANCCNAEAARIYRDMGFKRIILGREVSLDGINTIKQKVPDVEIEVFAHGAMCLAYSGRCFLSSWMTGRSGNRGNCAHSCRWEYKYLEEGMRPGEYYPVYEGDDYTTILSSKDICMIDHVQQLYDAGIDSIKIEGRMKSVYYVAIVTRAYRKAIDKAMGIAVPEYDQFRQELFNVSHRELSTGFYFGTENISVPTFSEYVRKYKLLGIVGEQTGPDTWKLIVKNTIRETDTIEYVGPDVVKIIDADFSLLDYSHNRLDAAHHQNENIIRTSKEIKPGYILRIRNDTPDTLQGAR